MRDGESRVPARAEPVPTSQEIDVGGVLRRLVETACRVIGTSAGRLVPEAGASAEPVVFGAVPARDDLPTLSAGVPGHDRELGRLILIGAPGQRFGQGDIELLVALASAAGVALDHARLFDETRLRERWLQAITDIDDALLGGAEGKQALALVARRARDVAEADLAAILLPDGDHRHLVVEIADGTPGLAGLTVEMDATVAGKVFDERLPRIVGDLGGDVDVFGTLAVRAVGVRDMASALLVPLVGTDRTLGVLVAAARRRSGRAFSDADLHLVTSFATQATLALERARTQEDLRRLAVLEDRDRIARDLHDLVIQRLFAVGLRLQGALRLDDQASMRGRLRDAVDDIDATINDIRATIFDLQYGPGLQSALRHVIVGAAGELGFEPDLRVRGPLERGIPERLHPHVVAVVREALSNVVRHAHAGAVSVRIEVGREIVVEVCDDGVGIGETTRRSGLRYLRERAEAFDGSMQLESRNPSGTRLVWTVPVGTGGSANGG